MCLYVIHYFLQKFYIKIVQNLHILLRYERQIELKKFMLIRLFI